MEPEKGEREEGGRQKRFWRRHEHLDQRFDFQPGYFRICLRESQTTNDKMLIWIAIVSAILGVALACDAVAGLAGLRGLRWTSLRPAGVLSVGLVALLGSMVLALEADAAPVVALGLLLALPLHAALALIRQRTLLPAAWTGEGIGEHHRATPVEIVLGDHTVPALLYQPHGPAAGAIALLHGAGAHKSFYSWPLVEALVHAGFAVCAIDLDGHGDNRRVLDFPSVLENVGATAAWLQERWRWTAIVGVSLGGCVAARAVAEGVVVDALAILESPATLAVTRQVVRHEGWTLFRAATWRLHRYAGTLPLIQEWKTEPTRTRIGTADLIRVLDLPASLARISCPLWLCYGGSDLVVPMPEVHKIRAVAPSGTPLVLVPRATHLSLPLEPRALRQLVEWLRTTNDERRTTNDER